VLKTYKLTYESVEVMHALFDKGAATNKWRISSKPLKEFIEHFGPRTEQLDIYQENGKATFTSYTEKIAEGKGKALQDFRQFRVETNDIHSRNT
jgi:cell cycle checkpoint control protein RAD9A